MSLSQPAVQNLDLKNIIETAWENRSEYSTQTTGEVRDAVDETLNLIDSGQVRIASKENGAWVVHQWLKKAVLLSFRLNPNQLMDGGLGGGSFYDKVPSKWANWSEQDFQNAGFRAVPGAIVRRGSFVAKNVVLMPSFVNIGAYVDEGTMVDTWATVGSAAQIGKNCHISGGAGIGGVLEPLQANPVIIEDNVFIGARSEVAEGVIVEEGAVLSMGVFLSQSTKIVNRETGEVHYGRVPAYSVVVPGTMAPEGQKAAQNGSNINLACAVIVKTVDAKTREKTSLNELLRD